MNNRQLLTAIATGLALLTFERRAVSDAPPVPEAPTAADWTERDNFLGQISMSYVQDSFHDRVDAFSGRLHINMVDVTLPGHGGLDLVVQRYYSSSIWNRADGAYPTHAASSDGRDLLGGAVRRGRVVADWPGLGPRRLFENRDLAPTLDLRRVAKGLLADHLGLNDTALLRAFPNSREADPLPGLVAPGA